MNRILLVGSAVLLGACATKRIHEEPIMENGDRVSAPTASVAVAREQAQEVNAQAVSRRDSLAATALVDCAPAICEAVARGEVAMGMSETQVLAATRTTEGAWNVRHAGEAAVMVPVSFEQSPRDASGQLAMVQLRNGRVGAISYREAEGMRVVNDAADATTAGRAAARADVLLREGDDYAARGDLKNALDRYDRAQVLSPGNALVDYRIATVLDKQLRPIEAQIRYRLFLHRLELEKIGALGDAHAKMADAIAHARERLIILEKRGG